MKHSKTVIAGAAIAGLLSGSLAARAYATSTAHSPGVSLQTMADDEKQPLPKHACKGQNECKGQGGGKDWQQAIETCLTGGHSRPYRTKRGASPSTRRIG